MEKNSLYLRSNYSTPLDLIIGNQIVEYDIHSAGFNCIREFQLLPSAIISKLENVPNKKRHIIIGKMNRNPKFKGLSNQIIDCIKECMKQFFEANNIDEMKVISIKKDAVFLYNSSITTLKFGQFIEYRPKNTYSSFIRLGRHEFFYNSINRQLDVKGISVENLKLHVDGVLHYLAEIFDLLENGDADQLSRYLTEFREKYINLELNPDVYRSFNSDSIFVFKPSDKTPETFVLGVEDLSGANINRIDISYNYKKIFISLVNLVMNEI